MSDSATSHAKLYRGLAASGGLVFAPVVRFVSKKERAVPHYEIPDKRLNAEIARFYSALDTSRSQIDDLAKKTEQHASSTEAGIFDSHLMMLDDTFFISAVVKSIRNQHDNAEWAIQGTFDSMIEIMKRMGDAYLRERVADIVDVRDRLIDNLLGGDAQRTLPAIDRPSIIIADAISPSDAVSLPRRFIRGMATEQGSLTAHVTILSRALGVPAVVGIGQSLESIQVGDEVALDGFHGLLWHHPDESIKAALMADTASQRAAQEHRHRLADQPAITPDGVRVTLLANTDHSVGFDAISEHGAEGIGLYRTEYLWIGLGREPSEEEQYRAYSDVIRACKGKPATLRVLDIGGDKMIGREAISEANPFLGNRSVRYLLNNLKTFRAQIRAILRAAIVGECEMMYPMIATLDELRACNSFVEECKQELEKEGIPFRRDVPTGVMIEIPSAALQAHRFAKEVAFFSIGTNDLVQYTFAVDRGNESVAHLYQPLHPVILSMIHGVVLAAKTYNRPVCVCGEMASDPLAAILLVGMGIRRLSMSANLIPRIKELICRIAYFDMQRLVDTLRRNDVTSAIEVAERCREVIRKYAPDVLDS
ncbi:MAG: phosphoenolpyruvate--protein phosphotransferase [Kiritimatiellia bacterium]